MRVLLETGTPVRSRLGPTIERSPAVLSWDLGVVPTRKGQSRYLGDVEASMVLLGIWDPAVVHRWCPKVDLSLFEPFARYGPLVGDQLDRCVRLLAKDPTTRRAVVMVGRPRRVPPCHVVVQFLARSGSLDVFVYVRSLDLVYGLPYDARTWAVVGSVVASTLRLSRGRLTLFVASLHAYERTVATAVGAPSHVLGPVPPLSEARDLARNFVEGGDPWVRWSTV